MLKEEARKLGRRIVARVTRAGGNSTCQDYGSRYHVHVYFPNGIKKDAPRVWNFIRNEELYHRVELRDHGTSHPNFGTLEIPYN